jgi:hypothetical protein
MQNQNPVSGLSFEQKLDICKSMPEGGYGSQEKTECFKNILSGNEFCHPRAISIDFSDIFFGILVVGLAGLALYALFKAIKD